MPKVLIISTEFPPAARSSGVQRIFNFYKYLPSLHWEPLVLTMHPMAYGGEVSQSSRLDDFKLGLVKRALAFNAAVHFAFKGRYFGWTALPDRWSSWVVFGFFSGLKIIKRHKPDVIFSSYPHASAHLLGLLLHKVTGLPWVADFRDPMLYHNTNVTGVRERFYQWIEKQTIRHCRYAIFTTPSAITQYAHVKFPEYPESKWVLIENGFDEADFLSAEKLNPAMGIPHKKKVLLHSGGLFPEERDPSCFFKAVALLLSEGMISDGMVNIILRASGDEARYQAMIDALGLQNIIFLAPKLDYQEALAEMLSVDGLLVFQGSLCNFQIPAKLYEYLRARKPILALTDPSGDTAFLLRRAELEYMADLDNVQDIALKLCTLIQKLIAGDATVINNEFIARQSREQRTLLLRDVFERCLSE